MSRKFDIFYILNYLNFSKIFSHLRKVFLIYMLGKEIEVNRKI